MEESLSKHGIPEDRIDSLISFDCNKIKTTPESHHSHYNEFQSFNNDKQCAFSNVLGYLCLTCSKCTKKFIGEKSHIIKYVYYKQLKHDPNSNKIKCIYQCYTITFIDGHPRTMHEQLLTIDNTSKDNHPNKSFIKSFLDSSDA